MNVSPNKNTIVFVNRVPTSRILADVIDFDAFSAAGFQLVLLDLSDFFYPASREQFGSGNAEYIFEAPWVIRCDSPKSAIDHIKSLSPQSWFFLLHHTYTAFADEGWLFRAFREYQSSYIVKDIDNLPVMATFGFGQDFSFLRYTLKRITANLRNFTSLTHIKQVRGLILTYMITRSIYFSAPVYSFAAGAISRGLMNKIYPSSRVVSIPSVDYIKYHRIASTASKIRDLPDVPYIVYIDQCPFAGPDAKLLGYAMIDKNDFFTRINRFLDRVERTTGKKVVIAASLKYRYQGDEFNGRKIYHNLTGEVTFHADATIAHNSTAVTLPILMKKPILFLHFDGLADFMIQETHLLASILGKECLNSEQMFDAAEFISHAQVHEKPYADFIRNYLAEEPFTESIGAVIARTLKGHNAGSTAN